MRGEAGSGVADLDQRHSVGSDRGEADRLGAFAFRAADRERLRSVAAEVLKNP